MSALMMRYILCMYKQHLVCEYYGHRIPKLVKYASGRIHASYPKLWPRNIISPRIAPIYTLPRVPRMPASSYAGYLASIALYYEGYGHPRAAAF